MVRDLEQCFLCLYGHPSKKAKVWNFRFDEFLSTSERFLVLQSCGLFAFNQWHTSWNVNFLPLLGSSLPLSISFLERGAYKSIKNFLNQITLSRNCFQLSVWVTFLNDCRRSASQSAITQGFCIYWNFWFAMDLVPSFCFTCQSILVSISSGTKIQLLTLFLFLKARGLQEHNSSQVWFWISCPFFFSCFESKNWSSFLFALSFLFPS